MINWIQCLKQNVDSVISVYKYQLDDIDIDIDIKDDLSIIGSEITLFQLWKNLILFSSKNFKSEQNDKFLRINSLEQMDAIEIQFHYNGNSIDREIINEIDSIQSIEDKVNPNLNLKLGIIKKIITDHKGRLNIESSEGVTIFTIIFPK